MVKHRLHTQNIIFTALFTALTAVCSWISIPLPFTTVPLSLSLIAPYLAGFVLGCKYGFLSQVIYILLGVAGLPVFAQFTGGISILLGPTGGFIIGYALCALICGAARTTDSDAHGNAALKPHQGLLRYILLMLLGLTACYGCGLLWFMYLMKASLLTGLSACVIPFLPGDAVKIALAALLSVKLPKLT